MKFDDYLKAIGDLGRYQKRILLLLCLPAISCGLHKLAWVFLGAIPPHRCKLPYELDNATYELPLDVLNASYPWDSLNNRWHQCQVYQRHNETAVFAGISTTETVPCPNGYIYDRSRYKSSVAMDWDLVCDRLVLQATTQALFMVGVLFGSLGFGIMSDQIGRRVAFLTALTTMLVCGVIGGVISDYFSFTAMRMVVGACTSGVFISSYVIAMEMVGPAKRILVGTLFQCFFAIGYLLTALFAYIIREWQILQVAISVAGIFFISYWWVIPESPRWLLQKGHFDRMTTILQKMAKVNRTSLPDDLFSRENLVNLQQQQHQPLQIQQKWLLKDLLFRYPNLRNKSLIIFFNWFVISGVYYGLGLNTSNLGGNDYINFVIFAAVEIPAYSLGLVLLDLVGRRIILCGSLLLGGATLLIIPAFDSANSTVAVILGMIGKFGVTSAYNVIYIFSTELFPTVIRNSGVGMSSVCSRIGGIIAAYLLLLGFHWKPLPLIIFGAGSVAAGLLALLLPETKNKRLPETLEDGEIFGK